MRLVHGSATALFGPTASASLSDLAPPDARGRWLGTYSAIQGSGQAAGPMVAGWLLASYGFTPTFLTAGVIGLAAWALVARGTATSTTSPQVSLPAIYEAIRHVASDQRIIVTSVAQAGQFVLHGLISAFLPIYAVEHGLSPAEAGMLFGVQMVTTIASRPVFGRLSDYAGRRPMIVLGLGVCATAVGLLPLAQSFLALLVVAAVYGAGLAVTTSSTAALITDLSHRSRYGAAHGLFGTIFDIGDALGPIAGGIVAAHLGYERTFQLAGLAVLGLAFAFAVLSRHWSAELRSRD